MSELPLQLNRSISATYEGFDLKFKDLLVWVPQTKRLGKVLPKKAILKGLSSHIKKGTMTAIIGPSGSGKTTLLNFLSGRQDTSQHFKTHCQYFLNDTLIASLNEFKNIIGYVLQDDLMDARLSPRGLFEFYAKLRGRADFRQRAELVVQQLSLGGCADTAVGDVFSRGISGGERKRTSIGIELVSEPNLLFLDEPTTGLDSSTALDIVQALAALRDRGITIIATVHQPSEEIMGLFDKALLIGDGHILFDGSPREIPAMLDRLGFRPPEFAAPVEFFMRIIDKDDIRIRLVGERGEALEEEVDRIHRERTAEFIADAKKQARERAAELELAPDSSGIDRLRKLTRSKNQMIEFFPQMAIFLKIYGTLFFRDFFGIVIKSILFWTTFVVLLVVFVKMPSIESDPRSSAQNKAGFYFMFLVNMIFGGAGATSTLFIPQKLIFMKDRQSRMYAKLPFFLSNAIYVIPYYIINVTISVIIYFYVLDLNNDRVENLAWIWALFFFTGWLSGAAIGMLISMLANSVEQTGPLNPLIILPQIVVAGFFANVKTITWPLFLFSFLTPVRFAYQGLLLVEFRNGEQYRQNCVVRLPCPDNRGEICKSILPPESADFCDPRLIFDSYETEIWLNFVVALVIMIGWQVGAFLIFALKFRERDTNYGFDQELYDRYCGKSRLPQENEEMREKIEEIE